MEKCADCWCEYYDINNGNCEKCIKSTVAKERSGLNVILKRRAIKQIKNNNKNKSTGQNR